MPKQTTIVQPEVKQETDGDEKSNPLDICTGDVPPEESDREEKSKPSDACTIAKAEDAAKLSPEELEAIAKANDIAVGEHQVDTLAKARQAGFALNALRGKLKRGKYREACERIGIKKDMALRYRDVARYWDDSKSLKDGSRLTLHNFPKWMKERGFRKSRANGKEASEIRGDLASLLKGKAEAANIHLVDAERLAALVRSTIFNWDNWIDGPSPDSQLDAREAFCNFLSGLWLDPGIVQTAISGDDQEAKAKREVPKAKQEAKPKQKARQAAKKPAAKKKSV